MNLREDANIIIDYALKQVLPDEAVKRALENKKFKDGKLHLVAIGKAAYQMAKTAKEVLKDKVSDGIVITKYDHVLDKIDGLDCYEAGHPVLDENSLKATDKAIELVSNLNENDTVIFLVSGGGSALFERPLVSLEQLQDLNIQLLACGADITEINCLRKRLSAVKGGKFAQLCEPAKVYTIVLSDILGDPLDMIASGPTYPDASTCQDALDIIEKYKLQVSYDMLELLKVETPKVLNNIETVITGSVKDFAYAAKSKCEDLGYEVIYLSDQVDGHARDLGYFLGSIAKTHKDSNKSLAYIAGGETIVRLTGTGKGGRNQEIALAGAEKIAGLDNVALFSVSSDGTDGPTDATGGYVDGSSKEQLAKKGIQIHNVLEENDSYHALDAIGSLVKTGPTGTNVNDISVVLIKAKDV